MCKNCIKAFRSPLLSKEKQMDTRAVPLSSEFFGIILGVGKRNSFTKEKQFSAF